VKNWDSGYFHNRFGKRTHICVLLDDGSSLWVFSEVLQQSIIYPVKLLSETGQRSEEEATQGWWIGKTGQAP
jgi:hypothetical protein